MDDDHGDPDGADATAPPTSQTDASGGGANRRPFSDAVDGFDDDYLPTVDDEYGPPIPVVGKRAAAR